VTAIRILPDQLKSEPQERLGVTAPDEWGREWSYVGFVPGTYKKGIAVRDHLSADLLSAAVGTATAAAAKGAYTLQDTGEFTGDDFYGAIGHIHDGAGQGQRFIVMGRDDDGNTLYIKLFNGGGWETAIGTSTKYSLYFPGLVKIATDAHAATRGLTQRDEFTVPTGERRYGWVVKTGSALGLKDNSAKAFSVGGRVIPTTGGLLIGVPTTAASINAATVAISTIMNSIGYSPLGEPTEAADDFLLPIELEIRNQALSYRFPLEKEDGYRGVNIGGKVSE
jgi:hypothetical protein